MKAVLVMDMPECCDKCFMLDDSGDYPMCRFTQEVRGQNFRTRERKMDRCPLRKLPEKMEGDLSIKYQWGDYEDDWNNCIDMITGE